MTSVLTTALRVLVTLMAIAGATGQVAYLDTLSWHALGLTDTVARNVSPGLIVLLHAHAIVSVISGLFAVALVLHEGSRQEASRALGVAFGSWAYLMAYSGVTMLLRPNPGLARDVFEGHFLLVEMIGLAGLLRFTALFPAALDPARIEPPPTLPPVLLPAHTVSVWMLRPAAPWVVGALLLVALWGGALATGGTVADAGLTFPMNAVRFVAAGLVVMNLRWAWGRTDDEGRERMLWLLVGLTLLLGSVTLMIGGKVLVAVAGFREPGVAWHPLVLDLGVIGFFAGMAFSILYRGPIQPLKVVRKVATVCSAIALGLFLAAGLEALLSGGILLSLSIRTGVGSALAAATMVSTYRSFERFFDRIASKI